MVYGGYYYNRILLDYVVGVVIRLLGVWVEFRRVFCIVSCLWLIANYGLILSLWVLNREMGVVNRKLNWMNRKVRTQINPFSD